MASALELMILASLWQNTTAADTASRTVTQATASQLSSAYSIPANEAVAGTSYELVASGTGVWGTTQQQANFFLLAGTATHQLGVASTVFPAGQPFDWRATLEITISGDGAAGTFSDTITVIISGNSAGTNGYAFTRSQAGLAFDTTVANPFQLNFSWAATAGAPSITCLMTRFRKHAAIPL